MYTNKIVTNGKLYVYLFYGYLLSLAKRTAHQVPDEISFCPSTSNFQASKTFLSKWINVQIRRRMNVFLQKAIGFKTQQGSSKSLKISHLICHAHMPRSSSFHISITSVKII